MIPKVLVGLLVAMAVMVSGVHFDSPKDTPKAGESCCNPGSACCEPGSACCGDC